MKLKNERKLSAPIAIARNQQTTLKGSAVITSIRTCCFTSTVDRIIRKDRTITGIFTANGKPSAVYAASMKSMEREQCNEGIQLKIFLSFAYTSLTTLTEKRFPSGSGRLKVVG